MPVGVGHFSTCAVAYGPYRRVFRALPPGATSGRYLRWKSFGVALESTRVEFPDEKV